MQHSIYLDLLWSGSKHSGFLKSLELLKDWTALSFERKTKLHQVM